MWCTQTKSYFRYEKGISLYIIPVAYGLLGVARTSSVYLTMAVTLERYFAIVKPLAVFGRIKKWLLPGAVTFAAVYNIPK